MENDSKRKLHILIVEDDGEIATFVEKAFIKHGFSTGVARDRKTVLAEFSVSIPDVVILDVMLPGESGFKILERIRQRHNVPVIMLTALAEPDQRVQGLTRGADDYVTKPFHTGELVARVEAVLRRSRSNETEIVHRLYKFDAWTLNSRTRTVADPSGIAVFFTSGEFDVLSVLCRSAGKTMGRDTIVRLAQNRVVEPYDRSIDTLVSRIRRKLQRNQRNTEIIKTVRGEGYVFTAEVEVQEL